MDSSNIELNPCSRADHAVTGDHGEVMENSLPPSFTYLARALAMDESLARALHWRCHSEQARARESRGKGEKGEAGYDTPLNSSRAYPWRRSHFLR